MTRETVLRLTPASRATSTIVAREELAALLGWAMLVSRRGRILAVG